MIRRLLILVAMTALFSAQASAQDPTTSATLSSTTCPGTGCVSLSALSNRSMATVEVSGGAWTGTLLVEISSSSQSVPVFAAGSKVQAASITANGVYQVPMAGASVIRVRASVLSSGTPTVRLTAGQGSADFTLPNGAATSALQTTGNSSLSSIDGKTPALGQATMANSSPVTIASDQSAVSVSGTVTANAGTGTFTVGGAVNSTPVRPIVSTTTFTLAVGSTEPNAVATGARLLVIDGQATVVNTANFSGNTSILFYDVSAAQIRTPIECVRVAPTFSRLYSPQVIWTGSVLNYRFYCQVPDGAATWAMSISTAVSGSTSVRVTATGEEFPSELLLLSQQTGIDISTHGGQVIGGQAADPAAGGSFRPFAWREQAPGTGDVAMVVRNIPSGTQTVSVSDGTNSPVAVKAASTAAVAADKALVVAVSPNNTVPVSAASLPLPTGAATSALQTTGNGALSSIDAKTPALGQATMANSSPVVIASDQSAVPVSGTVTANAGTNLNTSALALSATQTDGTQKTRIVDAAGDTANVTGTSIDVNCTSGCAAGSPGQQTMTNSSPVVIASDQSTIPVNRADRVVTGSFDSTPSSYVTIDTTQGIQTVSAQVTFSSAAGIAVVEQSFDGGATWFGAMFYDVRTSGGFPLSSVTLATYGQISATLGVKRYAIPVIGATNVRIGNGGLVSGGTWSVVLRATAANFVASQGQFYTPTVALEHAIDSDYDSSGGGEQRSLIFGIGIPGSGGIRPAGTTTVPLNVSLRDSAGAQTVAIKGPSTAAVATDPALVVAVSPNNTVGVTGTFWQATQPVSGTVTTTPPANASTNIAQFGGTNVSTGTGAGGAGIPRVTLSNDSSLAANQSVNQTQVNGVAVSVDRGVSDTGTQRIALAQESTYSASTTAKTATAAGTAAFFEICGSASKTIRIQRVAISGTVATAAIYGDIVLRKTSAAATGGTATTLTNTPYDSTSAAATATAKYFTALPTGGATLVGVIFAQTLFFPVTGTVANFMPQLVYVWRDQDAEAPTLRGTTQCLTAAFGTTPTNAPTLSVSVAWTEK